MQVSPDIRLHKAAEADFPTRFGKFRIYGFEGRQDGVVEEAVVLARGISEELSAQAIEILDEEALDIHEERHSDPAVDDGAIGTPGGFGRATGDTDRLTGERIGARHELEPDGTASRRR